MPLGGSGVGSFSADWVSWTDSPNAMPIGIVGSGAHSDVTVYDEVLYVPDMLLEGATSQARVTVALISTQISSPTCTVTIRVKAFNSSGSASTTETQSIVIGNMGIYWVTVDPVRLWRDRYNRLRISMDADANFKGALSNVPSVALAGFCVYAV